MFLHHLTPAQKNSFLALATRLALADGDLTAEENAMLNRLKAEMGENAVAPPEEVFGNTNLQVFDTPRARTLVMLELLTLGFTDEDFHPDEATVLKELADGFKIASQDFRAMCAWAQRQATLLSDAAKMMGA